MSKYIEKIRILWIDDKPNGCPEDLLPVELQAYFEIVHHPDIPKPSTIRCVKDFTEHFIPLIQDRQKSDIFPAEIIVMDYNLQDWVDVSTINNDSDGDSDEDIMTGISNEFAHESSEIINDNIGIYNTDFEGLILGIFISTLCYQHPIGIVPITSYYKDNLENVPEVQALHKISEKILNIDYDLLKVEKQGVRWEEILKKGVAALRFRIEKLYKDNKIVLSPSDILDYEKGSNNCVLTLYSPYDTRRLPIDGLFMDEAIETRDAAIAKWFESLLPDIATCDMLRSARELANYIWDAYKNKTILERRQRLSILAFLKKNDMPYNKEEYEILAGPDGFNVVKGKVMSTECFDILAYGAYNNNQRRWAALIVAIKLLKEIIILSKVLKNYVEKITEKIYYRDSIIKEEDLFLALFPIPAGSEILPWHAEKNACKSGLRMQDGMLNWDTSEKMPAIQRNGDLALSIHDLFEGRGWETGGPYGIKKNERKILQGFAYEEDNEERIEKGDWEIFHRAKIILWGGGDEDR